MADKSIASQVFRLIEQAEAFSDEQAKAREKALQYYNGEKGLIPYDEGYSSVVSRDVRKHIQKLMPSIMRTILSNDRIVEYAPAGPGDEDFAAQATDYVNDVIVPECGAERALHDAIFDWQTVKTGILSWAAYRRRRMVAQQYTGQPPEALLGLDEVGEVDNLTQDENGLLSFTLRRYEDDIRLSLRAVPRGAFLIHPSATSIDDSPVVGEAQRITRSELVSRGYDREAVWEIPADDESADPDERERRGEDDSEIDPDVEKAMEYVRVYDVYALIDADGDGIAELHHMVIAEGAGDDRRHIVLEHEPATEVPYAEVIGEYEAHQFEGHSTAEDLTDIQDVRTTLLRQTLDNVYNSNDPTPAIQMDAIADLDPVFKRVRGKPIILEPGRNLAEAIQYQEVPWFGDKTMAMSAQMDAEARDRTGISDAAGGLDPEALNGMSATGAAMINEAGLARAEMIVRNLARGGIRKAFRGLLKLVVAHADQPRTVRLRGAWVDVDPRNWNADMDCSVNVGLGTGTRERDMMVLTQILGMQKEVMTAFGPDNPLVKPDQLYNTLKKITETAGLSSADPYFTKPDPREVQAKIEASRNQPPPEQIKAQAQMQIEQAKAQARAQVEDAQMQADLRVKQTEIAGQEALKQMEIASQAEIARMKAELDALKHRDQMALEWAKLNQQAMQPQPGELPYVAR